MTTADPLHGRELIVAEDGSIPADQVERLGLRPGAHVRVIEWSQRAEVRSVAGTLPDFPDLDWDDFGRGSALARSDLDAG